MIQQQFADRVSDLLKDDPKVTGLAVGGSWIANELDTYSDLDLILVTTEKIAGNKTQMLAYAASFGKLLSAFTGDHVGEPRLLICMYDEPLLHVDIKFLTLPEFHDRVENPVILLDKGQQLANIINTTKAVWPYPDYQWLEDRFWTWVHYGATKLGRGEYFEAMDMISFIRARVLAPLLQVKNGLKPKALRKVERELPREDLDNLTLTVADYDPASITDALWHCVRMYRSLRAQLFPEDIAQQTAIEQKSIAYLQGIGAISQ
jgi:predicted nucleotidyltransferase